MPELDYDNPHSDVIYLLDTFYSVRGAVGCKISYQELKAFIDVTARYLSGWEVDAIMVLDSIMESALNG